MSKLPTRSESYYVCLWFIPLGYVTLTPQQVIAGQVFMAALANNKSCKWLAKFIFLKPRRGD